MAKASPIQSNQNSGEFSPLMEGRVDFDKYKNALRTALNIIPLVQGGTTRRPGSYFVSAVKDSSAKTMLRRFEFSDTQAYVFEFGNQYVRFYRNHGQGQNVLTISGAANNGAGKVRLTVNSTTGLYTGNTVTIIGISGTTEANVTTLLTVVDATHIDLTSISFINPYSSGGTATVIVELPTSYVTADLFQLNFTQSADVLYIANSNYAPSTISRLADTNWVLATLVFTDGPYLDPNTTTTTLNFSSQGPGSVTCTASSVTGINGGTGFQSTDIGRCIRARSPGHGWGWGKITAVADTTHCTVNLSQTVGTDLSISGAANNGSGLIRITMASQQTFKDGDRVVISGVGGTTEANGTWVISTVDSTHVDLQGSSFANPYTSGGSVLKSTTQWRLGMWSATLGYPAAVTFYQDRLIWGGADAKPQTVTASVTGDYTNHAPSAYDVQATVADNNALNFTLNSEDVQLIRWMSGDANGLLIGTVSGEWKVAPSSLGGPLTPTNIDAVQMTAYGNAPIQPVRIGYTTLALQKSRRKVRELTFVYYENRYHAPDMTVLSQHITLGGVTQMAYQQEPNSVLWSVRTDGVMLGFTYERDQQVIGWHRHVMGGVSDGNGADAKVESVATIPAPDLTRDETWMIVQRYINGQTVRHIEFLTKMWEHGDSSATAVYLDCALTYNGSPITHITGASHLANETVGIIVDGSVRPDITLDNTGSVTLDRPGSIITLGYAYKSRGQTLRNDAGASDGTAQGKTQRKHRVGFRLLDSLGFTAGRDFNNLNPQIARTTADSLGAPPPLFTGDDSEIWEGDYSTDDTICYEWTQPYPGTLLAIMPQQHTMDR